MCPYLLGDDIAQKYFGRLMNDGCLYDLEYSFDKIRLMQYLPDEVTLDIYFSLNPDITMFDESDYEKFKEIQNTVRNEAAEQSESYSVKFLNVSEKKYLALKIRAKSINVRKILSTVEKMTDDEAYITGIQSYTVSYGRVKEREYLNLDCPLEGTYNILHENEETGKAEYDPIDFFNYIASGDAPEATYGVVYNITMAPESIQGKPYDESKLLNMKKQGFFYDYQDVYYIEITPENALEIYNEWHPSEKNGSLFYYAIPEEQTIKAQMDLFFELEKEIDFFPFVGSRPQGGVSSGGSETIGIEISSEDIIDGDANNDKKLTIADSAAILQSLANADKYGLSLIGELNADVYEPGSGISGLDALRVQEMVASKGEV